MIAQWVSDLGVWSWFILGLILLVGEVVLPGIFLFWFGLAALTVGSLTLLPFTEVAWWPWQVQLAVFGALSLVLVLVGSKLFPSNRKDDRASKINAPLSRLEGREAVLVDAIENGMGRIKLGDTVWRVKGTDAAAGTRIRVVGTDDNTLVVEVL